MSRIAITGLGIVSGAGRGLEATLAALREGRSGLGPLRAFASPRNGHLLVAEAAGIPLDTRSAASGSAAVAGAASAKQRVLSRSVALGAPALSDALAAAGLSRVAGQRGGYADERVGLALGCTVGGMPESERALTQLLAREVASSGQGGAESAGAAEPGHDSGHEPGYDSDHDPDWLLRHECGYTTSALARAAKLRGPALTVSTACSSGAQALGLGAELLLDGAADAVVAGGVDALCRLTLNGFASLLAVDPEGCRPFDRDRRGMSLGEGAAFLVLERLEDARARGATPLALLAGWGTSCDAYHATAPEPEGRGAEAAMRAALAAAGRDPREVDYVNAHGTGTLDNDRAEGRALRRLFDDRLPPLSSTKRVFGHTLGAAGAIEALVCVLALRDGFLPPNPGFSAEDPDVGLRPLIAARAAPLRLALSNSFGFGGNNAALALEAAP